MSRVPEESILSFRDSLPQFPSNTASDNLRENRTQTSVRHGHQLRYNIGVLQTHTDTDTGPKLIPALVYTIIYLCSDGGGETSDCRDSIDRHSNDEADELNDRNPPRKACPAYTHTRLMHHIHIMQCENCQKLTGGSATRSEAQFES